MLGVSSQSRVHIILYLGGLFSICPPVDAFHSHKPAEVFSFPIRWIPETFQFFDNLQAVFKTVPFATYYFNSLFVSLAGTALTVLFCTLQGTASPSSTILGRISSLYWS